MNTHRLKNWGPLLIFLAAMLWATDSPFRVHLLKDVSANLIVLGEHFFDTLVLLPFLILQMKKLKHLSWKEWGALVLIAVGGSALASIAFTQAFNYVNPSVAILLQKLQPLIAISLAAVLLRETLSKSFWIWCIVALIGGYVLSFPHGVPKLYEGETFNPNVVGVSLALVAAFLWGASTVLGKYALRRVPFGLVTTVRFSVAFIFLLIWNAGSGSLAEIRTLTNTDWLYLFIIACVSGVVSLWIYYRGLTTTKASVATIAELGFPVAAVIINWLLLDATLEWTQIVGTAVLLFSVLQLTKLNNEEGQRTDLLESKPVTNL